MPEPIVHDAFRDFVVRECDANRLEQSLQRELTVGELVERGLAISDLTVTVRSRHTIRLRAPENVSRFRAGDRLELESGSSAFTGTLTDISDYGRDLNLTTDCDPSSLPDRLWVARGAAIEISPVGLSCLDRLKRGDPGFWLVRTLAEAAPAFKSSSRAPMNARLESAVAGEVSPPLDGSQMQAFQRCIDRPAVYAIQGPPGTGKTRVLALVAEALAQMGYRTLVLAPTHQAVNNALSTVRSLFPQRRTVKVGDPLRNEALHVEIERSQHEDGSARSQMGATPDTVTGMTFVSALTRLVLRRSGLAPHVLLIDEAGQLPLVHGITAGLTGASSILLFGDDRQMPPVFPGDLSRDPLAVSLLSRLRDVAPESVLMLATTYRLNETLCSLVGRSFYADADGNARLKPSPSALCRRAPLFTLPRDTEPLIAETLDPAHSLIWVRSPVGNDEQHNPTEARFVADLVLTAMRAGIPPHDLAVVSPFRRQVALVRSLVRQCSTAAAARPISDTVERVQGLTVELVIVTLSVSSTTYADALRSFLQSPNRMNVATSRARSKVVIVAAPPMLTPKGGPALEPFVSVLMSLAHVIDIPG